jgi:hypothetical protein
MLAQDISKQGVTGRKAGSGQSKIALPQLAALAPQAVFSNTTPITIGNGAAVPYPSTIAVSGLVGNITKVTMTITGFTHNFPDDVDMLLVAPNGALFVPWSDNGGNVAVSNLTITLDDAAATALPDTGPLTSGTFKPSDFGTAGTDNWPTPAPAACNTPGGCDTSGAAPIGAKTFATQFNGLTPAQANGTWSLYIVSDTAGDSGSISGGWSLNISQALPPTTVGQLIISEFRLRGPGGAQDEFIEIYNPTAASVSAQAADASAGLGIVASDGTLRCTIPNGTPIPARGHFLCANTAYSLINYPSGNNGSVATLATADAAFSNTTDIPDIAGIALFNNSTAGSFTAGNMLDAVGPNAISAPFKEGTGLAALPTANIEYAYYRKIDPNTGLPTDTGNNVNDFTGVSTTAPTDSSGLKLGAPGPENLTSPIQRNATIKSTLIDPGCTSTATVATQACPRFRTVAPVTNGAQGTLSIRRRFVNGTGGPISRLRFRIVDMTTFPAGAGNADMRALTSGNQTATCIGTGLGCPSAGSIITINGTTLEEDTVAPNAGQPNGGGLNSSLTTGTVSLGTTLANGASVNLQFLLGINGTGNYRFFVNVEALP